MYKHRSTCLCLSYFNWGLLLSTINTQKTPTHASGDSEAASVNSEDALYNSEIALLTLIQLWVKFRRCFRRLRRAVKSAQKAQSWCFRKLRGTPLTTDNALSEFGYMYRWENESPGVFFVSSFCPIPVQTDFRFAIFSSSGVSLIWKLNFAPTSG